jgi:hypothetical protein
VCLSVERHDAHTRLHAPSLTMDGCGWVGETNRRFERRRTPSILLRVESDRARGITRSGHAVAMGSLGVKQAYLVAYNTAQAAGWAWALCLLVQHLIAGSPPAVLYAAVTPVLRTIPADVPSAATLRCQRVADEPTVDV